MEIEAADAERMLQALFGARAVAVERHAETPNGELRHDGLLARDELMPHPRGAEQSRA
jgi:hypothetical protein